MLVPAISLITVILAKLAAKSVSMGALQVLRTGVRFHPMARLTVLGV